MPASLSYSSCEQEQEQGMPAQEVRQPLRFRVS